jgi:hypothetical protein
MRRISHMKDIYIFLRLCVLVLVQVVCFVVWYLVDKPSVFSKPMSLDIGSFQYVVRECKTTSRNAEILLWIFNGGVLLNLVRLTVSARNIPRRYNEVQVMGLISYFCIFFIIVLVPALQFLEDAKTNYVIFVSMVFIMVTTAGFLHTIPKLYQRNLTSKDLDGKASEPLGISHLQSLKTPMGQTKESNTVINSAKNADLGGSNSEHAASKSKVSEQGVGASKFGGSTAALSDGKFRGTASMGFSSTLGFELSGAVGLKPATCSICQESFQQKSVSECACGPKNEVIL